VIILKCHSQYSHYGYTQNSKIKVNAVERTMTEQRSAGLRFRQALEVEKPLQIIGTVNAYAAMMAKQVGYKAIYLSGAGVANYSYGLPDLGMTSLDNVLEDVRRITERVDTPLLVDIDTGWGGAFNIARTVKQMIASNLFEAANFFATIGSSHAPGA
jgi:methylisocitrate lyase